MLTQVLQARKLWLITLMVFMLVAVQLAQASPLHDHTKHEVDCALCHLPLSDESQDQGCPSPDFNAQGSFRFLESELAIPLRNPSPYHGRAPPEFFL